MIKPYINWGLAVPLLLTALVAGATDAASVLSTNQPNWLMASSVGLATFLACLNAHINHMNATSRLAAIESSVGGTTMHPAVSRASLGNQPPTSSNP